LMSQKQKCGTKHAKKGRKGSPTEYHLEFTASERKPQKRTWLLPSKLKHMHED